MAVRVQDFPKKSFCQSSIQPMPHFPSTTTAWWNFQEHQFPQPLSKSLSLKVGSSPQSCQEGKHAGHQPQGQDSSSTQSTDQHHQEVAAVGGNNSQDQCISSDTGFAAFCFLIIFYFFNHFVRYKLSLNVAWRSVLHFNFLWLIFF